MESKAYFDGAVLSQDCLVLETKREGERVKGEEVKESNYFLERAPLEPGENMWDLTYGVRSDWPWADEKTCTGVFPPISQPSGGQRRTPAGHERHFTVFLHGTQITSGWEPKKKKKLFQRVTTFTVLKFLTFYSTEKNIRFPADFVCLPTDKEMIRLIVMVGLLNSERQNNNNKSRTTHLKKVINWFAF